MNTDQREQLRIRLLMLLTANPTRFGLATRLLVALVRCEAWRDATDAEIDAEMEYLADGEKGLVVAVDKSVSPENRAWRITAKGRDFLAERGLQ